MAAHAPGTCPGICTLQFSRKREEAKVSLRQNDLDSGDSRGSPTGAAVGCAVIIWKVLEIKAQWQKSSCPSRGGYVVVPGTSAHHRWKDRRLQIFETRSSTPMPFTIVSRCSFHKAQSKARRQAHLHATFPAEQGQARLPRTSTPYTGLSLT